jgi:hypothetical protein
MQDGVFTIEVKMENKTKLIQKTSSRKLHGALIPTCVISTRSLGMGMPNFFHMIIIFRSILYTMNKSANFFKKKIEKMLKMKNYHQIFKI